ncbi:transglutaminase-like domain-containing protein [Geosporobacter ferrireducens]|uniref:Transglutaminase-like domain-containing protein n=1 Tax=Geosporobacter ferrireducens TaxID=1424294 RepID=A0A1D8GGQ2_9FIRM|nr:transglutaminase-like domain-containing protein [Geosporobacter ferrireducens]AOT70067.1 hypothetical protein Gferi_10990 [Geosporobacter ferrireducens]MTI53385.1 transglutaminase domain-containing protein [Geosporobacter ferrireducens]
MKKLVVFVIGFIIIFTNIGFAAEKSMTSFIDGSMSSKGVVNVKYLSANNKKLKLVVEKEQAKYIYNLKGDDSIESFPLQLNNGQYKISVLENIEGKSYKPVLSSSLEVELDDPKKIYLNSIQNIQWDENTKAVQKAKELTKNLKTDEEKIQAVYAYVVKNVKYDYDKIGNLNTDYVPVVDETFKSNKGICYDFSSMFAAMLRSLDIPTKLVKGYTKNAEGYHAWNEVLMNGKWVVIDTTYDSQMDANNKKYTMSKDAKVYDKVNEY